MEASDLLLVLLLVVICLIVLDFFFSVMLMPHEKDNDDVKTNFRGIPFTCKMHTWTYDTRKLLYCSICKMRPGDNRMEIDNEKN